MSPGQPDIVSDYQFLKKKTRKCKSNERKRNLLNKNQTKQANQKR